MPVDGVIQEEEDDIKDIGDFPALSKSSKSQLLQVELKLEQKLSSSCLLWQAERLVRQSRCSQPFRLSQEMLWHLR